MRRHPDDRSPGRRPRRDDSGIVDDRLRLIFTCCHPALAARGPGRAHAAHAGRAHHRRDRPGVPGARADDGPAAGAGQAQDPQRRHPLPGAARPPAARADRRRCWRCSTCCSTRATRPAAGADLVRAGLCDEAIRLARMLARLMPDEPEALGLLALMLLHDARRADPGRRRRRPGAARRAGPLRAGTGPPSTRASPSSRPPSGGASPGRTRSRPPSPPATPSPAGAADTDWTEIAGLYGQLARMAPVPGRGAQPGGGGGDGRRARGRAGAGRRARRVGRAARLPPAAGDPRRPVAPAGPSCRGGRRLPGGPGPGRDGRRAAGTSPGDWARCRPSLELVTQDGSGRGSASPVRWHRVVAGDTGRFLARFCVTGSLD